MATIRSNHYVLAVPDLARSRAWYEGVLGCETEVVDGGNWEFYARDGVVFLCGACPDAIDPEALGDHQYFAYIVVDDADAEHARVSGAGGVVTKSIRDEPWGMREFGVRTVDGHRIMFAQKI